MIERMTKYSFILLSADKEKFLADLAEMGVVDITRSTKPVDGESAAILAQAAGIKQQMANLEAETSDELVKIREELQAEKKKYDAALPWGRGQSLPEATLYPLRRSTPASISAGSGRAPWSSMGKSWI